MNTTIQFHAPERPYTPIDSLNLRAAAAGSPVHAMKSEGASYNGHHVTLDWNDRRGYYITQYFWAGRRVLARGDFAHCLQAAMREYDRGAVSSCVSVWVRDGDTDARSLCESTPGLVVGTMPNGPREWYTWRHEVAADSVRDYAHPGYLAIHFDWDLLQASKDRNQYQDAIRAKYGQVYA